jgi:hypothetical protein
MLFHFTFLRDLLRKYIFLSMSSLRCCQLYIYSRISRHFMETKDSLRHSQEPSTGSYPEPDQSSPYHPILSNIHFNIIHQSVLFFLLVSLLLTFPPIFYMHSSSPIHATSLAHLILLELFKLNLAKSTSYEAPHYEVFSNLSSLHLSLVKILSSALCSQTPSFKPIQNHR